MVQKVLTEITYMAFPPLPTAHSERNCPLQFSIFLDADFSSAGLEGAIAN
jgi:hypothetical protein